MKKIKASPGLKGIIYSFSSAIFVSVVFIVSRLIRQTMDTPLFLFWWFGFASTWVLLILINKRKDINTYIVSIKNHKLFFCYIASSETALVSTFFYLIKYVNPAVLAFFTSLAPFFVVVIAFFYIKEKLSKFELTGGLISIAGVLIITYVSPDVGFRYFVLAISMVLLFAFNNVLVRKKVQDVPPLLITMLRIFSLFLVFLVFLFSQGGLRFPTLREGLLLAAGSLSGPLLSVFSLFSALKYIKAANVSLIKNSQPFLVIIFSALFLKSVITFEEFLGGAIIVTGISILLGEKGISLFVRKLSRPGKKSMMIVLLIGFSLSLYPGSQSFREVPLPRAEVLLKPAIMLKQVEQVIHYIQTYRQKDRKAVSPGLFSSFKVTLKDVESTLLFCRDVLKEDMKKGKKFRLQDPVFLNEHFRVLRWFSSGADPKAKGRIRITKYAVFTIKGRNKKEGEFKYALYELPGDEQGISLTEAKKQKDTLSRFKYTKQMVKAGAYGKGGARPLVWVSEAGLEEALMQGTVCVKDDRGRKRYFNVNRSNDIPYDHKIADPKYQKRYWYFTEVKEPKGYGMDTESMVTIYPDMAYAGDVYNLGLGKLMAIKGSKIRLGILADTGGFFTPNLNRLDYFTGVFETYKKFKKKKKTIPEFAEVYILIKRNDEK